jgi:hypothetical protein
MRKIPIALLFLAALVPVGANAAPAAASKTPRPDWPTVERQLAADRIAPATALAKLVRENQDFSVLRAAETHDRLPVPLWLRVWWRKAHPDSEYLATDATGGYPLALQEVYEWMLTHPDLKGEGAGSFQVQSQQKRKPPKPPAVSVTGGPDRSISVDASSARSESDIRVNYWNTDQIVSASNNIEGSGALAIYYSRDGGGSWKQTFLPKHISDAFHSDPTVEWTSDGTAWATTLEISNTNRTLTGTAFRSSDGGATWTFDGIFSGDQTSVDKQMTWVDHSESSPFKDNLYVIYHNGRQVFVNHRTPDGGWGEPLQISGGETLGTGIGSDIKTNQQGTVFAFWPDSGSQKLFMARSTNGGASFSKPLSIGKTFVDFQLGIPAQNRRGVLIYTTGGAFLRNKKKNMVYAAWTDLAGGRGCAGYFDMPGNNQSSGCTSRIWFASSSNGGTSWSRPGIINNQKTLNDQFNPWLVVDETTGNVALMYYDSFGEERSQTNVWAQVSVDDGGSWSAPYKVTSAPSDENNGLPNGNQYGDYNGMSGYAGTFFPSWTDRRAGRGTKEEIWTAPLTIESKAVSRSGAFCPFSPLFSDQAAAWSPEAPAQPVCKQ